MSVIVEALLSITRPDPVVDALQRDGVSVGNCKTLVPVKLELGWDDVDASKSLPSVVMRHIEDTVFEADDEFDGLITCLRAHVAKCNCCGESVDEEDRGYVCECTREADRVKWGAA